LNKFDGTLLRIDPDTNQIAARIQVGKGYWATLSVGDGAVWVMDSESSAVKDVDPQFLPARGSTESQ
jgi:DNA-binding beta-propeller fold protein YncE